MHAPFSSVVVRLVGMASPPVASDEKHEPTAHAGSGSVDNQVHTADGGWWQQAKRVLGARTVDDKDGSDAVASWSYTMHYTLGLAITYFFAVVGRPLVALVQGANYNPTVERNFYR